MNAHNLIFEESINYSSYESPENVMVVKLSLISALLDYIVQLADCMRPD
jgi:hypothetical protein